MAFLHGGDGDVRTLVVRAVIGNFLGTRAQAGDGHDDFHRKFIAPAFENFAGEGDFVIHQAAHARDWRSLAHEVGKSHFNVAGLRFKAFDHLAQHGFKAVDGNFTLRAVENFQSLDRKSVV